MLSQKLYYEQGNKSERLLASALRQRTAPQTIHKIRDKTGRLHSSNQDIATQFQKCYQSLYSLPQPLDRLAHRSDLLKNVLDSHCPPPIAQELASSLDAPLTPKELIQALKQRKPGKSLDSDGFTTQYYKTLTDVLLPHFLKAFNSDMTQTPHSTQLLEAHITVIHKGDKDCSLVTNYRPILLLNVDIKWYAKALANRLVTLLPSLFT